MLAQATPLLIYPCMKGVYNYQNEVKSYAFSEIFLCSSSKTPMFRICGPDLGSGGGRGDGGGGGGYGEGGMQ